MVYLTVQDASEACVGVSQQYHHPKHTLSLACCTVFLAYSLKHLGFVTSFQIQTHLLPLSIRGPEDRTVRQE